MNNYNSKAKLDLIKADLIDGTLIFGTTLGFLVFLLSFFPVNENTFNFDFYTDIFALTCLFMITFSKSKHSIKLKASVIIIVLILFVSTDVYQYGLYGTDTYLIALVPFLSILVFTARTTFIIYAITIADYLFIGYLISNDLLQTVVPNDFEKRYISWIESAGILTIASFAITLFVYKFNQSIFDLYDNLETQNTNLSSRDILLSQITNSIPRTTVLVIDSSHTVLFAGGQTLLNSPINEHELIGKKITWLNPKASFDIKNSLSKRYNDTFNGYSQVFEIETEEEVFLYQTVPLKNENNEINSILVIAENVTEEVEKDRTILKNLEEKNVMIQEIHHRVKNNLAIVSGLLTLQNARIDNAEFNHIISKSVNRILSIARVHELLYESQDFTEIPFNSYVEELSSTILSSMNSEDLDIEFSSDIQVESITINQAIPLGIIFNELITNTIKYGFSHERENEITISVTSQGDLINVIYYDNGKGIEHFDDTIKTGLGFTLIDSLLSQIDATHSFKTNEGFELSFSFPIQ